MVYNNNNNNNNNNNDDDDDDDKYEAETFNFLPWTITSIS